MDPVFFNPKHVEAATVLEANNPSRSLNKKTGDSPGLKGGLAGPLL
ncbi:MAG: hypothetical protein F7C09_04870 [Aeropyrum sp.]|nr:hypothetical protein [Aeropyrum sp.]